VVVDQRVSRRRHCTGDGTGKQQFAGEIDGFLGVVVSFWNGDVGTRMTKEREPHHPTNHPKEKLLLVRSIEKPNGGGHLLSPQLASISEEIHEQTDWEAMCCSVGVGAPVWVFFVQVQIANMQD
jgi:hypothetical protein